MKLKKHILKLSILAAVLACAIIAGSMFALGAESNAQAEPLNLTVVTSALNNGEFTVTAKIANPENVKANKVAGLEVTLKYPDSVTVKSVVANNDLEGLSETANDYSNGRVKFVCIKDSFDSENGYETLGELFTVTFSANGVDPSLLFDSSSVECLIGDVNALEVAANSVYAGDLETLANAVLEKGFEFVVSGKEVNRLVVAIAPTPAAGEKPTNKTGDEIEKDGKKAQIVVKGDLDRDGVVSVFDANMIKDAGAGTLEGIAADLGADNNAKHAVDYVVGNETQITK